MAGIIVQLAVSWLLVWLIQRKDLKVLGFTPTRNRLYYFFIFLLITAFCCSTGFLLRMLFAKERWEINPLLNAGMIVDGLWWNIKSVLFEELIFRGVILYILIERIGVAKAIAISSIAFGIYHWFSFDILGNVTQMVGVFIITGSMGAVLAYGYAKMFSLYIPCAIHLGWNFTQIFVFSSGTIGNGIFILSEPAPLVTVSYFTYFLISLLPLLSALLLNTLMIRRIKNSIQPVH